MFLTKHNGMIIGPIAILLGMCMNGIFYVLNQIGIPNIGLSIIIMTILIYMAMLPLTIKQQKFSKLQRKMQPELNKINKKYENRKDPESMQRQQDEIKEVYGKYGVSATGSCVQLIIQMPILFYNIPAYVPLVKQAFFPLVDKLIAADSAGEYLQATNAARYFARQFENESFVNGVTEYVQNTFIDVLNKFNGADWEALIQKFPDLQGDITNTLTKLTRYNSFLGLNMANSPSYMFKEALGDKTYLLAAADPVSERCSDAAGGDTGRKRSDGQYHEVNERHDASHVSSFLLESSQRYGSLLDHRCSDPLHPAGSDQQADRQDGYRRYGREES